MALCISNVYVMAFLVRYSYGTCTLLCTYIYMLWHPVTCHYGMLLCISYVFLWHYDMIWHAVMYL